MRTNKFIIAVPARLESSRLPNKVLADIGGKSMINRTLEACKNSKLVSKTVLCTDSRILFGKANSWGFDVLMTSKNCQSGTERIASVFDDLLNIAWGELDSKSNIDNLIKNTFVINVQGDQPFIDPKVIDKVVEAFSKKPNQEVITPIYKLKPENIHNPNVVKTLINNYKEAIYFSRSPLPHVRDVQTEYWYKYATFWGHVGIYGYRGDILNNWNNLSISQLEKAEKLEQLRILDGGYKISTIEVEGDFLSVDTLDQLEEARKILSLEQE